MILQNFTINKWYIYVIFIHLFFRVVTYFIFQMIYI